MSKSCVREKLNTCQDEAWSFGHAFCMRKKISCTLCKKKAKSTEMFFLLSKISTQLKNAQTKNVEYREISVCTKFLEGGYLYNRRKNSANILWG